MVICYVFNLTTAKWRFISLPDALNILRVATVLTLGLVVLDYIFVAPNVYDVLLAPNIVGGFFLGKVTIILFWFLEVLFLSGLRFAYRYFRYTRTRYHARTEGALPTLLIGRAADAEILLRGIESGAVTRLWPVAVLSPSAADRGQLIRSVPVLGGISSARTPEGQGALFCDGEVFESGAVLTYLAEKAGAVAVMALLSPGFVDAGTVHETPGISGCAR